MEKKELMMSRSLFCASCFKQKAPRKFQKFLIFRYDHQQLAVRINHQDGIWGFTPHIIQYSEPILIVDGKVTVQTCCGMEGCGVTITDPKEDGGLYTVRFDVVKDLELPYNELLALEFVWRNTGYEII